MLPPSLHERAGEVLLAALARPASERDAFVVATCQGDDALLREVASLLLFHDDGDAAKDPGGASADFAAGDVFAGRYRMVARAGRGGMGDVWRAHDLILDLPVALKLIPASHTSVRARLLQEVRLARQITHPAVCRVFDVGEAGETIFYTMEFVHGEDLAALLKRSGRLTSERVIEIAQQLCGGLAAAHAQGVLHRDLKPANILIDQDGRVQITDFGIAVTTRDIESPAIIGTPGYMAPEQLVPGAALTERTDIYALGVVLYELVTGESHQASPRGNARAERLRTVPGIALRLERAILKATAQDPEDRPATALELASDLQATEGSPRSVVDRRHRSMWLAGGLGIVVLAVAAVFWSRSTAVPLTSHDEIIVADFLNSTGDAVFDSTLKVALVVALEQSPFLKVFPDERARRDLQLMQRSPTEGLTRTVSREIAQREQLQALIAGSITSLGRHYVIGLEAVAAVSGDVIAREQIEANSKEEVLSSLGQAASKLRRKLGESLASIQRYDVPLPQATTPSLEALQAYALALDEGRINPRIEAIPHLQRALQLDPHFALAMAQLSGTYANTGQPALAPEWSRKAFELRDRVSERERYMISWRYYRDATQAWDKARDLARAWTAAYPREPFAFNSLGFAARSFGDYPAAIDAFRQSARLDPKFIPPVSNLSSALTALNKFDDARTVIESARSAGIDHIALRREAYILAFIGNDTARMARELDAALARPEGPLASNWQPRISAFGGRIEKAHEEFRRGIAAASDARLVEASGQYGAQDATAHAVAGQCTAARAEATAAIGRSRDNLTLHNAAKALAWCGADAEAAVLSAELARRFPEAVFTTHVQLPVIAAATAIRSKHPERALELLDPVKRFDHSPTAEFWPAYLRGVALLQLNRAGDARDEFRSIVDHRGEAPDSMLYPLAQLGLARACARAGDAVTARAAYLTFFELWKDADPRLGALTEAQQEFRRLEHR